MSLSLEPDPAAGDPAAPLAPAPPPNRPRTITGPIRTLRARLRIGEVHLPKLKIELAVALRRAFRKGYGRAELRADLLAGLVVGVVAIPLSMALAMAVGVPPQHGLYTAATAGVVTAGLGGSKFQVTGPTAAFVVILAPIVAKYGLAGLLTAGMMGGVILIALGAAGLGRLIRYVPFPVTTGFTAGIALVIATLQLKDIFGLETGPLPDGYTAKLAALVEARGTTSGYELAVALVTLSALVLVPRWTRRVPAPLVAIGAVSVLAVAVHAIWPDFHIATIGNRFTTTIGGEAVHGIPAVLPTPSAPWEGHLSWAMIRELFPAAVAIALLGAIESLLSAVIADGMTGTKHDSNTEVVALGVANVVTPFFGGIAATGALARTATNVRAGARSPIAAITHAGVILLALLVLAPLLSYVPMASLAALLLLVAWNMSERRHFAGIIRLGSRSDIAVLLTCFVLTVLIDMVVAVTVGFILAALLFMRRMAEITEGHVELEATDEDDDDRAPLPAGVLRYRIDGPLFFGAAESAMQALHASRTDTFQVMILDLARVPAIDATGFTALEDAVRALVGNHKQVVLAGPFPRPREIFENAALPERYAGVHEMPDLDAAIELAAALARPRAAS
jgi:SulP family sulfate permease